MEEEYKMLREEIMQKMDTIHNLDTFVYTTTTALFAFGFERSNWLLFLLPLLIIVPVYLTREKHAKSISKIAAYMIVFLEGEKSGFRWETRGNVWRMIDDYTKPQTIDKKPVKRSFRSRMPYTICAGLCGLLSLFTLYVNEDKAIQYLLSNSLAQLVLRIDLINYAIRLGICIFIIIIVVVVSLLLIKHKTVNYHVEIENEEKKWKLIKEEEIKEALQDKKKKEK